MGTRWFDTNYKGGEGKTQVTVNVAAALAAMRYKVLVVDMDPQGNASRRLGVNVLGLAAEHRPGIAQVLDIDEPRNPHDAVVPCGWDIEDADRIDVLPSINPLAQERRAKESGEIGAINRLRRALDGFDDPYHFTLIDGPPGLNHLFDMSAAAADRLLVVLKPEYDGVLGAQRVVAHVERHRDSLGRPDLRVGGVIVNGYNAESATHRDNLANLPAALTALGDESRIWTPVIPQRSTVAAAQNDGLPLAALTHPAARQTVAVFETLAKRMVDASSEE